MGEGEESRGRGDNEKPLSTTKLGKNLDTTTILKKVYHKVVAIRAAGQCIVDLLLTRVSKPPSSRVFEPDLVVGG